MNPLKFREMLNKFECWYLKYISIDVFPIIIQTKNKKRLLTALGACYQEGLWTVLNFRFLVVVATTI